MLISCIGNLCEKLIGSCSDSPLMSRNKESVLTIGDVLVRGHVPMILYLFVPIVCIWPMFKAGSDSLNEEKLEEKVG